MEERVRERESREIERSDIEERDRERRDRGVEREPGPTVKAREQRRQR